MSPHATAIAIVSVSLAAAVELVKNYEYRGALVAWLWSLASSERMPEPVSVTIAILLWTLVFSVVGLILFRRDGR